MNRPFSIHNSCEVSNLLLREGSSVKISHDLPILHYCGAL
jgi:hypothetical protein